MDSIREQRGVLRAMALAMATKPFLILAGISGSGKTQLARRLAAGVAAGGVEDGRYTLLTPQGARGLALMRALVDSGVVPALLDDDDDDAWLDVFPLRERQETQRPGKRPEWTSSRDIFRNRVAFLPVRPDWRDARDMWGSYNPLTGLFYPTRATRVLLHAMLDFAQHGAQAGRHVLILDEMNIARVEYFLSDLLSLIESGARVNDDGTLSLGELVDLHPFTGPLWVDAAPQSSGSERRVAQEQLFQGRLSDAWLPVYALLGRGITNATFEPMTFDIDAVCFGADWSRLVPPRLAFPPNLTLVGTVNVDETTHALSPKVLDRAFVVEFNHIDLPGVCGAWPGYAEIAHELEALHAALGAAGHPFGYRVVRELLDFLRASGRPWSQEGDFLISSKLLPKLRGTEEQLAAGLWQVLSLCVTGAPGDLYTDAPLPAQLHAFLQQEGHPAPRFPRSAARVYALLRELQQAGVTSFL